MAVTYTENYKLGKQENHADKFDMSVITENMDKIDKALSEKINAEEWKGLLTDDERKKLSELKNYDDTNIKAEIESASKQIRRTNISSGANLNTLDMGEGAEASDFKFFLSRTRAITESISNLPPEFPYDGFSLEYYRIHDQQWCQRITSGTKSATGDVKSVRLYFRLGSGMQPDVVWGGWFMLSPVACSTASEEE